MFFAFFVSSFASFVTANVANDAHDESLGADFKVLDGGGAGGGW